MKSEQVRTLPNTAIERLAKALDAGQSNALTTFLRVAARFHRHSFRNVMLIAMQRPDATRVAGFHTWRKLARFVKRGEKLEERLVDLGAVDGPRDRRLGIEEEWIIRTGVAPELLPKRFALSVQHHDRLAIEPPLGLVALR